MDKLKIRTPDKTNNNFAALGAVDAERFISMVKRDTFDYTEWQRKLWNGKSIEEIHLLATEHEKKRI